MSAPEPGDASSLTGKDYCPTCETVVTWQRHVDERTSRVVHDACGDALVPHNPENRFHARAMGVHEAADHEHQLLDAHGRPPAVSIVSGGNYEIILDLPISCMHCEATSADLVAALDDSDHDTEVTEDRVRVWPVNVVLPAHLSAGPAS